MGNKYGEPWHIEGDGIYGTLFWRGDHELVEMAPPPLHRAVACVNAMAGIKDPAALVEWVRGIRGFLAMLDSGSDIGDLERDARGFLDRINTILGPPEPAPMEDDAGPLTWDRFLVHLERKELTRYLERISHSKDGQEEIAAVARRAAGLAREFLIREMGLAPRDFYPGDV